ncbi:MAG: sugar phosphate isomerase/epimerase, partial [Fimbriimonadales bacterium]|nr:sugar phosphate isomerase/epimerase [Fimbriimonadales bacterium]
MSAFKIGINRWTLPGGWDVNACLRAARESGFDAIEFNMEMEGVLSPKTSDADARAIRQRANEIGIELSSLSTGVYWSAPFTHPDPAVREQAVELCRQQLRLASALGVDAILVVPGVVTPDVPYDVAYARAQDALKRLAPEAEQRRVYIAVENVWNRFLLSPL